MKIKIIKYIKAVGVTSLLMLTYQVNASLGSEPLYYKVVGVQSHLNARTGSGRNFKVVSKLKSGANLQVDAVRGQGRNKWALYYAEDGGGERWVNLNYLKEHSGHNLSKVFHVYTDEDAGTLNVRAGPSRNRQLLKSLPNGTTGIKILSTQKRGDTWWARIKWNGKVGWVHSYYLVETQPYIVVKGDTLFAIMEKTGADWKHIIRMNKLSKPYALAVGQKLKLPRYD